MSIFCDFSCKCQQKSLDAITVFQHPKSIENKFVEYRSIHTSSKHCHFVVICPFLLSITTDTHTILCVSMLMKIRPLLSLLVHLKTSSLAVQEFHHQLHLSSCNSFLLIISNLRMSGSLLSVNSIRMSSSELMFIISIPCIQYQ